MLRCNDTQRTVPPLACLLLVVQISLALADTNCSTSRCSHSDFLCGEFREPCRAVGSASFGIQLWQRAVSWFAPNQSYRRTEYSHFDEAACVAGQAWIEVVHEGLWQHHGGSSALLSASLASQMVTNSYIRLLEHRPCLTPVNILPPERCFDAAEALELVCPCNGTNWTGSDSVNISMDCVSAEECPMINEVYLGMTQYFTYNSTDARACFWGPNTDQAIGWRSPDKEICVDRLSYLSCIPSPLSSVAESTTFLWTLLLGVASLECWSLSL
eukprot:Skav213936  [mRNA]  locus=scaffold2679:273829:274641:- [translate_table: standard]